MHDRLASVGSRSGRFAKKIGLAVVLVYVWMFVWTVTGAGTATVPVTDTGAGVVQRCERAGPLGMYFWHSCELEVRWDSGYSAREVVPPPDLAPRDVGRTVRVEHREASGATSSIDTVRLEQDYPSAWLGWLIGLPCGFVAALLALFAVGDLVRKGSARRSRREAATG